MLVKEHLLQDWEAKDEPEHLRTIRDRILRNPQQVCRLLGIYQHILQTGEIKNYEKAIDQLLPIAQNVDARFYQPAQWYAAMAYLQLNQSTAAKMLLTEISTSAIHPFQDKAKRLLSNW